jgi:hypothetical protein
MKNANKTIAYGSQPIPTVIVPTITAATAPLRESAWTRYPIPAIGSAKIRPTTNVRR